MENKERVKVDVSKIQTKAEIMLSAGLAWTVSKQKVYNKEGGELAAFKAITRDDTGHVFHVSRNRYTPFQNEALFNVIEDVTGTGQAKYLKAGSYKEGAYVYGVCAVPDSDFNVVPGDICRTYLRISTTHDGSGSINIWPEIYRQVCKNGMHAWAKDAARSISVRHTESAGSRITFDAGKMLQREREYFASFAEKARALASREFSRLQLDSFLHQLFEIEEGEKVSTRTKNQMEEIAHLARRGAGSELAPGTAWAAYNGVTEYVTHKWGKDQEARAMSAIQGGGRDLRERAFQLLNA
jgi:phage/plasmid-like protein (TIGR03299 family)